MYRYDEFDHAFVSERVDRFRAQVARRVSGALNEDEFKPLRLQNGLYLQLHAYMLRVAIPYGTLNSRQMRRLADIAERYDRGYGHFTTRQNIQYNWVALRDAPEMLAALAEVEMHAIQTSGNCIRNVTADHFAGAAGDELIDPRPTAELIRQWSTEHPEFGFLPRKFKIAVTGSPNDRAVVMAHDIGLRAVKNEAGEIGWEVIVGGGLGRTPMEGKIVRGFLTPEHLLPYLEAILRVYNAAGRRDNKYKARIKIQVHETGLEAFREAVEAEFAHPSGPSVAPDPAEVARIAAYFAEPAFEALDGAAADAALDTLRAADPELDAWVATNTDAHRQPGYAIVTISLKEPGRAPGDASAEQMRQVADLAEQYAGGEIRVSHEQNLVLPHVRKADLPALHAALAEHGLATANAGLVSDIIACPGLDYCALATARSIPIAQEIAQRFGAGARARDIGELKIKISGCINACGHHHVGHIGILGLEKAGRENYQITFGGDGTERFALGQRAGRGLDAEEVSPAIERVVDAYLALRTGPEERFVDAYRRVGPEPFVTALYATGDEGEARDAA